MPFTQPSFTLFHVLLSLVGILAGLVVGGDLMAGRRFDRWTAIYLGTTVLTNATGFVLPFRVLMPSHILGGISLIVLPVAMAALYWKHLAGRWRGVFIVTAVVGLYFNALVFVAQLFAKVPAMILLAPTQKEPAFGISQVIVVACFIALGRAAWKGYRHDPLASAS